MSGKKKSDENNGWPFFHVLPNQLRTNSKLVKIYLSEGKLKVFHQEPTRGRVATDAGRKRL